VVLSEELSMLESCILRRIMINSVLEEFRVSRFVDIGNEICCRIVFESGGGQ